MFHALDHTIEGTEAQDLEEAETKVERCFSVWHQKETQSAVQRSVRTMTMETTIELPEAHTQRAVDRIAVSSGCEKFSVSHQTDDLRLP